MRKFLVSRIKQNDEPLIHKGSTWDSGKSYKFLGDRIEIQLNNHQFHAFRQVL